MDEDCAHWQLLLVSEGLRLGIRPLVKLYDRKSLEYCAAALLRYMKSISLDWVFAIPMDGFHLPFLKGVPVRSAAEYYATHACSLRVRRRLVYYAVLKYI